MTKKYVFVAEDLLLHGIGDEPIFVTQVLQIMKNDENTTFSDINETSQKSMCVVVIATFMSYCRNWISWQYILLQQKNFHCTSA